MNMGLGADIREFPPYCLSTSMDPRSWFRGLLPQCAPLTPEELEAMTASQMRQACRLPDGTVDEPCYQAGVQAARESVEAAARSDPEGTCEYNAVNEWPTASRVLGPSTVCKIREGKFNALFLLGGAALLILFVSRGR